MPTTGFEDHHFQAKIPFSWAFIDLIADILKESVPTNIQTEGLLLTTL